MWPARGGAAVRWAVGAKLCWVICPYRAAVPASHLRLCQLGYQELDDAPIVWLALFGQKLDRMKVFAKTAVKGWRRLVAIIVSKQVLQLNLVAEEASGHSLRTSGIVDSMASASQRKSRRDLL